MNTAILASDNATDVAGANIAAGGNAATATAATSTRATATGVYDLSSFLYQHSFRE